MFKIFLLYLKLNTSAFQISIIHFEFENFFCFIFSQTHAHERMYTLPTYKFVLCSLKIGTLTAKIIKKFPSGGMHENTLWKGCAEGLNGVGIIIAEEFIDKVRAAVA